ncbi:MAG: hypothetical protein K0U12_05370 [Gammaproteobacteria bacterium]|nr:hypothetical protein [Gammaproteobacteria bacterium]
MDGNLALLKYLREIGITQFYGVNGGGVIHILKYLDPNYIFNLVEYLAGFAPLGHFLVKNELAACIVTTGAAEKLAGCGASDARFYNIPAVYILPLNNHRDCDKSPLQDVSAMGMHMYKQYKTEFGDAVILIERVEDIYPAMVKVLDLCEAYRPAFLFFYPDLLSKPAKYKPLKKLKFKRLMAKNHLELVTILNSRSQSSNVILFICREATITRVRPKVIADFVFKVGAKVIYSVNGSRGASQTRDNNFGHLLFGGNEASINMWKTIKPTDIVISLGLDIEEYVLNLEPVPLCKFYCLTNLSAAYGQHDNQYKHRVAGEYYQLSGDIELTLQKITSKLSQNALAVEIQEPIEDISCRQDFNFQCRKKYVDIRLFYQSIDLLWRPNSFGFDDICTAYRDRQAVLNQPNSNITFFTLSQGSAMGSAFGLGVGAAISDPHKKCFVFSGDGCSRYFIGNLSETSNIGLVVFIFSNEVYGIVKSVLSKIMPDIDSDHYHDQIAPINYQLLCQSMGWSYKRLSPDLSNLTSIMERCYQTLNKSLLIEIPCDPNQSIGKNNREQNLYN